MAYTLEVCVDSIEAAISAEQAGADRIELCSALALGGLTPGPGLLRQAHNRLSIPWYVLIRSRAGDFCYSAAEAAVLLDDIAAAKSAGAHGLVLGALNPLGDVDLPLMRDLMAAAAPLPVTFHRAFDRCRDPETALEAVVTLGAARILSSGQAATAWEGRTLLRRMVQQADGRLSIMPGSGIHADHVAVLAAETGALELHFSATRMVPGPMAGRGKSVAMGKASVDGEDLRPVGWGEKILGIRGALGG
ncbi:MAG: copper homeostasis protein CutC [Bacteroidota bacterium]